MNESQILVDAQTPVDLHVPEQVPTMGSALAVVIAFLIGASRVSKYLLLVIPFLRSKLPFLHKTNIDEFIEEIAHILAEGEPIFKGQEEALKASLKKELTAKKTADILLSDKKDAISKIRDITGNKSTLQKLKDLIL